MTLFKKVDKLREYKAGNALLTHLYRFSFEGEYPHPLVEEGVCKSSFDFIYRFIRSAWSSVYKCYRDTKCDLSKGH